MIFGATLFGGIHIGAWDFHFPTRIDMIVWRSASIYSAACGPVILVVGLVIGLFERFEKQRFFITQILIVFYTAARLALLVETFRTLFLSPPLASVSIWTADVPHFG